MLYSTEILHNNDGGPHYPVSVEIEKLILGYLRLALAGATWQRTICLSLRQEPFEVENGSKSNKRLTAYLFSILP